MRKVGVPPKLCFTRVVYILIHEILMALSPAEYTCCQKNALSVRPFFFCGKSNPLPASVSSWAAVLKKVAKHTGQLSRAGTCVVRSTVHAVQWVHKHWSDFVLGYRSSRFTCWARLDMWKTDTMQLACSRGQMR